MSVDVSALKPTPATLKKGVRQVQLSYNGNVGQAGDNDVSLELFVDPQGPIFIQDSNGNLVKSIVYKQKFPLTVKRLTKTVTLSVTQTTATPRSCSLRLEATDARGFKSACNSHIIIFK